MELFRIRRREVGGGGAMELETERVEAWWNRMAYRG